MNRQKSLCIFLTFAFGAGLVEAQSNNSTSLIPIAESIAVNPCSPPNSYFYNIATGNVEWCGTPDGGAFGLYPDAGAGTVKFLAGQTSGAFPGPCTPGYDLAWNTSTNQLEACEASSADGGTWMAYSVGGGGGTSAQYLTPITSITGGCVDGGLGWYFDAGTLDQCQGSAWVTYSSGALSNAIMVFASLADITPACSASSPTSLAEYLDSNSVFQIALCAYGSGITSWTPLYSAENGLATNVSSGATISQPVVSINVSGAATLTLDSCPVASNTGFTQTRTIIRMDNNPAPANTLTISTTGGQEISLVPQGTSSTTYLIPRSSVTTFVCAGTSWNVSRPDLVLEGCTNGQLLETDADGGYYCATAGGPCTFDGGQSVCVAPGVRVGCTPSCTWGSATSSTDTYYCSQSAGAVTVTPSGVPANGAVMNIVCP